MTRTIHLAGRYDQKAIPGVHRRKRSGRRIARLIRKECDTASRGGPVLVLGCAVSGGTARRLAWNDYAETETGDTKDRGRRTGDPPAHPDRGTRSGPKAESEDRISEQGLSVGEAAAA